MKGGFITSGFTIIETLIVLGVSSFIVFAALLAVQGRVGNSEFNQSVNTLRTQLQQYVNDVANGYYPNQSNFTCSISGTTTITITPNVPGSGAAQGTNTGCVFLGKMVGFTAASVGTPNQTYGVHTIIGLQCASYSGTGVCAPPSTTQLSYPTVLTQSDLSIPLTYGVTPKSETIIATATDGGGSTLYNAPGHLPYVGFFSSASQPGSGGLGAASGSQQVNLYSTTDYSGTLTVTPEDEIDLCFLSSSSNQSAKFVLGKNGTAIINSQIFNSGTCS